MNILRKFVYQGPNRRSDWPVVELEIELSRDHTAALSVAEMYLAREHQRILELLEPSAGPVSAACAESGDAPEKRFAAMFSRSAICLQRSAGHPVRECGVLTSPVSGVAHCYFEYEEPTTADLVIGLVAEVMERLLRVRRADALDPGEVHALQSLMALLAKWNMAPVSPTADGVRPERDHIDIGNTFVAVLQGRLVGVASFLPMGEGRAETASLAVDPECLGCGIGYALQARRLEEMRVRGIRCVQTEADRPNVIRWYIDKFGHRATGRTRKRHAFGDVGQTEWTVLELEIR